MAFDHFWLKRSAWQCCSVFRRLTWRSKIFWWQPFVQWFGNRLGVIWTAGVAEVSRCRVQSSAQMFRRTRLRFLVILVSLVSVALIGVYRFRPLDASVRVEEGPYCDMALSRNHVNLSGWQSDQCHLHQYTKAEVAECLNELSLFRNQKTGRQHQLQFTFVGDSRTRLQFFSFLQVI